MSRIFYACLCLSAAMPLVACKKDKTGPSVELAAAEQAKTPPAVRAVKRSRWGAATVVAGNRSALVAGSPAPEHSLWEAGFEGKDARDARLTLPYMAVQDAAGQVFIADKVAHSVRRVDEIQEIHTVAGTGVQGNGPDAAQPALGCALSFPNALWVQPSGRLYILDFGNAKLRRLDLDGNMETVFELPKDLKGGRGLAISADESVFFVAAKDRIYRYDRQTGPKVFAQGFVNLGHLALAPSGVLYAADRDAGYVYQIDKQGNKKVIAPNPSVAAKQGLNQPRALVWVPGLGLLIGTQGGRRVYRLRPDGDLELLLDGANPVKTPEGPHALRLSEPLGKLRGLSVAPNGDLLLTHGDVGQVLRFNRQGS